MLAAMIIDGNNVRVARMVNKSGNISIKKGI